MGKAVQQILKDPDRKNLISIGMDLTRLLITYGSRKKIGFYAIDLMYKKDAGKIEDYAPKHVLDKIKKKHLWKRVNPLIKNKLDFADFMENYHYPVPQYWGKIQEGCFYDKDGVATRLRDRSQLKQIFKKILTQCPSVFVKPIDGAGGVGHQKIGENTLSNVEKIDFTKDYIIQ